MWTCKRGKGKARYIKVHPSKEKGNAHQTQRCNIYIPKFIYKVFWNPYVPVVQYFALFLFFSARMSLCPWCTSFDDWYRIVVG